MMIQNVVSALSVLFFYTAFLNPTIAMESSESPFRKKFEDAEDQYLRQAYTNSPQEVYTQFDTISAQPNISNGMYGECLFYKAEMRTFNDIDDSILPLTQIFDMYTQVIENPDVRDMIRSKADFRQIMIWNTKAEYANSFTPQQIFQRLNTLVNNPFALKAHLPDIRVSMANLRYSNKIGDDLFKDPQTFHIYQSISEGAAETKPQLLRKFNCIFRLAHMRYNNRVGDDCLSFDQVPLVFSQLILNTDCNDIIKLQCALGLADLDCQDYQKPNFLKTVNYIPNLLQAAKIANDDDSNPLFLFRHKSHFFISCLGASDKIKLINYPTYYNVLNLFSTGDDLRLRAKSFLFMAKMRLSNMVEDNICTIIQAEEYLNLVTTNEKADVKDHKMANILLYDLMGIS